MSIHIVTDSTCDVPAEVAEALNITVVPVYINIGKASYLDGVDLSRREFFTNLASYPTMPTTAAPAVGTFTAVYQQLADQGATEILSLHIASALSATSNSARLGAEAVEGITVTIFDTQQITLGSGLLVIAAAEAAADGKSMPEIVKMLESQVCRTHIFAVLDTLEFLRRSGRVSWAQFGLGTLLRVKPILTVHAGEVLVAERVRTQKRAAARLINIAEKYHPFERLALLHANAPEAAQKLQTQLQHLLPDGKQMFGKRLPRVQLETVGHEDGPLQMEITPAIGAHVGPGAVGFAFIAQEGV